MTPTPPSTTSSTSGHSPHSPDAHYKVVRKRNRVPLSCAPCRHRKLKCNRSHPCENCIKRGDAASCSYAGPTRRKNQNQNGSPGTPDQMQNRIDRLESFVLSLMTNGNSAPGPAAALAALPQSSTSGSTEYTPEMDDENTLKEEQEGEESETDQVTKSLGVMKFDNSKSTSIYIGQSHWAAILSDIAEVKTYWSEHKKQYEEQVLKVEASRKGETGRGPTFLFGVSKPSSREEIMDHMPSRTAADKLVARYFNSSDPAVHVLHFPTFRKQYERYWADPESTSIVWIGLLYAIMALALQSYHRNGDEPPEYAGTVLETSRVYRNQTAQCLVLADYTKPITHMIEALILHLQTEYGRNRDTDVGVWVMIGIVVRLAMRMGYHRDPKWYPSIPPFEGEMRRRVWTFVRQMDLLFSFQIGLPTMVRMEDCDTALPRNLYDDDLVEGAHELPLSRPYDEPTPVLYMITKTRLSMAFGRVVEKTQSLLGCSYEETTKLDQNLREVRATIPPHFKIRPPGESINDPAMLLMQRIHMDLIYQKAQCVLHKRFLASARTNPRYAQSRQTCVEACLEILRHQATLHYESTSPMGRLRSVKWFLSSLTSHDFLLAAMIVCLDLHYEDEAELTGRGTDQYFSWGSEMKSQMMEALERATALWTELRDESIEAYKASECLTVMLNKLKRKSPRNPVRPLNSIYPTPSSGGLTGLSMPFPQDDNQPEHSAAMTLGMV